MQAKPHTACHSQAGSAGRRRAGRLHARTHEGLSGEGRRRRPDGLAPPDTTQRHTEDTRSHSP